MFCAGNLKSVSPKSMENYLLYGEILSTVAMTMFKGRQKNTISFVGIHRYEISLEDYVAINVRTLHMLKHDNVLEFFEWYKSPQHVWIVTELASGGTLGDIMDVDGPMPVDKACTFIADIASGLKYVHSQGIVHCDLTPSKLLLDSYGTLKVSDFSLAQLPNKKRWDKDTVNKSLQLCYDQLTEGGSKQCDVSELVLIARKICLVTLPCPFYLSPEALNMADFTISSDLWSFGCIINELLTGFVPFVGKNPQELSYSIMHGFPFQIDKIQDEDLRSLVIGLLEKDTSKRREGFSQLHNISLS